MTKMKKTGKGGVAKKSGKVSNIEAAPDIAATIANETPEPALNAAPEPTPEVRGRGRPTGTRNKVYPEIEAVSNAIKTERHEMTFLRCQLATKNPGILPQFDAEMEKLANTSRAIVGRFRSVLSARDELAAAESAYDAADGERRAILATLRGLSAS